jgi:hypothetical protein
MRNGGSGRVAKKKFETRYLVSYGARGLNCGGGFLTFHL